MRLKALLRSINLLNVLLAAALLFVLQFLLLPLANVDVRYAPASPKKAAETEEKKPGETPPAQAPSLMEYTVIAEQNLFHPERHIPPEKKEAPPLPKPEFVLYGVMISDELTLAYLEDQKAPQSTPGRGKRQVALKKGDSLSGFVLKDVEPEKVVMVRGEERMDVYLIDSSRPKKREGVATTSSSTPPPVTQPGTAGAPPGAPQRTPAAQRPATAAAPQPAATAPQGAAQTQGSAQTATPPVPAAPDKESARRSFTDLLMKGRSK